MKDKIFCAGVDGANLCAFIGKAPGGAGADKNIGRQLADAFVGHEGGGFTANIIDAVTAIDAAGYEDDPELVDFFLETPEGKRRAKQPGLFREAEMPHEGLGFALHGHQYRNMLNDCFAHRSF